MISSEDGAGRRRRTASVCHYSAGNGGAAEISVEELAPDAARGLQTRRSSPQCCRCLAEDDFDVGVEHRPQAAIDLAFQLAWTPADVAHEVARLVGVVSMTWSMVLARNARYTFFISSTAPAPGVLSALTRAPARRAEETGRRSTPGPSPSWTARARGTGCRASAWWGCWRMTPTCPRYGRRAGDQHRLLRTRGPERGVRHEQEDRVFLRLRQCRRRCADAAREPAGCRRTCFMAKDTLAAPHWIFSRGVLSRAPREKLAPQASGVLAEQRSTLAGSSVPGRSRSSSAWELGAAPSRVFSVDACSARDPCLSPGSDAAHGA